MQNLDLTKWLAMVWQALNEPDEVKRNRLLRAADMFLQKDNPRRAGRKRRKTASRSPRPTGLSTRHRNRQRTVAGIEHFIHCFV
jgi:hypothetical protein